MGKRLAYGDVVVQLEAAALAVGRLDAALSGYTLLLAWTFWSDLAPPDRTRSDVCHAAAFMSISAWTWAGVLYPTPECRRRLLYNFTTELPQYRIRRLRYGRLCLASVGREDGTRP